MVSREQYDRAVARSARAKRSKPSAEAVRFDPASGRLVIDLSTGYSLSFPPHKAQELQHASPEDLENAQIGPSGFTVHFPRLDADLYVPGLVAGAFGSEAWNLAAEGGKARTSAKAAAARENGKRGGRPRKLAAG